MAILGGGHRLRELAAAITQWAPGGFDDAMNVIVLTILLVVILQIVEFPFAFYQGHLLEHRYGLSTQSTGRWLADHAKGVVLGLVLAVAGTSVVFVALRESPDQWWWISALVFAVAMVGLARLAPVVLLPIFYKFKPLDRPALVDRLMIARDPRAHRHRRRVRMGAERPHAEGQRGAGRPGQDAAHPAVRYAAGGLFGG